MSLHEDWVRSAYTKEGKTNPAVWKEYLPKEQKIYEYIIGEKIEKLEGTVKEFSEKYDMTPEAITAFVDGINDVLPKPYEIDKLTEKSKLKLVIDFEKLYKKMVEYKAKHLYTLPQWDSIYTEEERKRLYNEQKASRTIVKEAKIGRNDPCPCGSGKKYKKCCGANV